MHISANRTRFALIVLFFAALLPSIAFADTQYTYGANLFPNGSFETNSSGWTPQPSIGNSTSFTYPVAGLGGGKALGIKVTSYSGGDIFWQPANVPVTAGKQYLFSAYSLNSAPVPVIAAFINSSGRAVSFATFGTVSAGASWQKFVATTTIPTGAVAVRIQHVMHSTGSLAIDDYALQLIGTTTGGTPPPPPPPSAPVITSFTATPSSITAGQSSTLGWATTGATLLTIDQSVGTVTGTSKSVSPSATTTYTLSAGNSAGTTTATVTVNVAPVVITPPPPPAAPTCTMSANPTSIVAGNSSTLTFSSTNASSSSINNGVGAVANSGTKVVTPSATTTYTDTVTNPGGTGTCSATVNVNAPPPPPPSAPVITSFTATPSSITAGQSSTLGWATTGATLLTIDQSVGTVTGTSKSVSPSATTTYTLSAGNSAGTTTATVTVNVAPVVITPPPPPNNLIPNGNLEAGSANNPTGWSNDFWGSLTPTFTYPVAGNGGGKAAQIKVTNFTTGAANWVFNHITTDAHTQYNFSEDYMATAPTELDVEYLMSDGSFQYDWLQTVQASASWQTLSAQVTPPTGAVSFTVLHILAANGTLTIDNASLTTLSDPFASGMVTFTFDDGLLSQYQNAVPIIKNAGFNASFYIITTEPDSGDSGYMDWTQIKDLQAKGYEIGGHTRTHPFLTQLTPPQITDEVTGSYTDLIAQGITPKTFVYPFGDVNSAVETAVKTAGYQASRGSYAGLNGTVTDRYDLYDIRVDSTTNLATIEKYIDQAKADKRWIILELHDVMDGGDTYSITPAFFQSLVNYITSSGIQVAPMQQAMSQLSN